MNKNNPNICNKKHVFQDDIVSPFQPQNMVGGSVIRRYESDFPLRRLSFIKRLWSIYVNGTEIPQLGRLLWNALRSKTVDLWKCER